MTLRDGALPHITKGTNCGEKTPVCLSTSTAFSGVRPPTWTRSATSRANSQALRRRTVKCIL
eukprot:6363973-Amphidinium_carterae.1